MARPYKHPKTGIWWFRARVPLDVAAKAKGRNVAVPVGAERREILLGEAAKVSLATRDPAEAKVRHVAVLEALISFYEGLRTGPVTLSFRQRQVISGTIYKSLIAAYEDEPGDAAKWREMAGVLQKHATGDEAQDFMLEMFVGQHATEALDERGLVITHDSRRALLHDVVEAFALFLRDAEGMALKDYSARRFPTDADESAPPKRIRRPRGKAVTFSDIIDERVRRKSAGRDGKGASPATISIFRRVTKHFADWRGSDDATTVTRQEVEGWMAARQADAKVGNRTISQHVVNVGTVWNWGRKHDGAAFPKESPFTGIERPDFNTIAPSERAFRLNEARAILHAARKETEPGKRWLPFIAAYSGARISELSFLRPEDFRQVEGNWFFRIDDSEIRAVKTKSSRRTIPVHPALMSEGLMEFVQDGKEGAALFKARDHENIGRWLRGTVKIEREGIQPNHAWRHLMTDFLTNTGASNRVRLALLGRASGSSEDAYGGSDVALIGIWRELAKVPAIIPPPNAAKPETDEDAR